MTSDRGLWRLTQRADPRRYGRLGDPKEQVTAAKGCNYFLGDVGLLPIDSNGPPRWSVRTPQHIPGGQISGSLTIPSASRVSRMSKSGVARHPSKSRLARSEHASAVVNDLLFIFGGRRRKNVAHDGAPSTQPTERLGDLRVVSLLTNTLMPAATKGAPPAARYGHTMSRALTPK